MTERPYRNEPPREPPDDAWPRIRDFAKNLFVQIQRWHPGPVEHIVAAGTLAAGVAFMKSTGASEEQVLSIARKLYRDSTFRLLS